MGPCLISFTSHPCSQSLSLTGRGRKYTFVRYTPSGGGRENGVTLTRQGLEVSVMILRSTKCFLTGSVTHDANSPSGLLEDSRC